MFKFLLALAAFACITFAFPKVSETTKSTALKQTASTTLKKTTSTPKDNTDKIVSNTLTDDAAGNFAFAFETSNNIKADAKGSLKKFTSENGTEVFGETQEGSYKYVGDDGKTYEVKWIADENGFQPQADFLPTAPKPSK